MIPGMFKIKSGTKILDIWKQMQEKTFANIRLSKHRNHDIYESTSDKQ